MGNVVGHYNSGGHSHSECGLEVIRAAAESVGVSSSSEYPMGALSGPLRREKHKDKHHKGGARVVELRGSTHGVPELQQLGGKAKKLIELDGVVTVPPGCVVTSSVYAEVVVARLGLRFDLDDDDLLREGHKRILGEARVPVDVCVAVDRVTAQYPGTRWAVRSSATLEDGSEFSMAGLAESFLFVDAANVSEAVVKCWASLWTTRVGKYFQNADISQTPLMAVVVQQMIVPRAAGVLFTLHPVYGTGEFMSVEAVHGAGEALVSGVVDPTAFKVDLRTEALSRESHKKQMVKLVQSALLSGLEEQPTSAEERDADPLSVKELWELVETGKKIASFFGAPQDIEFVVGPDGMIHIVQTRPVTRFSCANVAGNWFSGFALKSWLAMSMSSQSGYYRSKTHGMKTDLAEAAVVKSFFGIAFVSSALSKLGSRAVGLDTVDAFLQHAAGMEPLMWSLINNLSKVETSLLFRAVIAMMEERVELAFLSFSTGAECRILEKELDEQVLESEGRAESSAHVLEMEELAAELRKVLDAMQMLIDSRFDEFRRHWAFAKVDKYLRKHFFHCALDEDILETRWIDDPQIVLSMLRLHLMSEPRAHTAASERSNRAHKLKSTAMKRFRDYLAAKDNVHETYLRGNFFLCKMLQEVNIRLNLPVNDVFFCDWRTLAKHLSGTLSAAELRKEIALHRYIRDSTRVWNRPTYISRNGVPGFHADPDAGAPVERRADGVRVLSGTGGSPGLVTGVCKVCSDLNEAVSVIQKGDILVTSMTSPAWTPLFSVVAGVITEHGGRLSHAAVVARECGLPAVLGLDGACKVLQSGTVVQVDGTAGTVAVLVTRSTNASDAKEEEENADLDEDMVDLSSSRDELIQSRNA